MHSITCPHCGESVELADYEVVLINSNDDDEEDDDDGD